MFQIILPIIFILASKFGLQHAMTLGMFSIILTILFSTVIHSLPHIWHNCLKLNWIIMSEITQNYLSQKVRRGLIKCNRDLHWNHGFSITLFMEVSNK